MNRMLRSPWARYRSHHLRVRQSQRRCLRSPADIKIVAAGHAHLDAENRTHEQEASDDADDEGGKGREGVWREARQTVEHQRIVPAWGERHAKSHQAAAKEVA